MICLLGVGLVGCSDTAPTPPETQPSGIDAQSEPQGESTPQDQGGQEQSGEGSSRTALVTGVIDGDTIELEGVGRVRLIGVDTPERGEECFDEATDYLRGRVGGHTVRYRYQQEREDRYDRQLLDIFRGGELVNLDIAQAGWGEELTIAPNDRYADRIAQAEAEARAEPRGRWAGCFTEPEPEPEPAPSPPAQEDDDDSSSGGATLPPPPPDLDCADVSGPVSVGSDDPHRLDADGDGIGCE